MKAFLLVALILLVAPQARADEERDSGRDLPQRVCDAAVHQMEKLSKEPVVQPVRPQLERVIKETKEYCDK
jgi:hypothetical protein